MMWKKIKSHRLVGLLVIELHLNCHSIGKFKINKVVKWCGLWVRELRT